jgi:hypothetical protein
MHLTQTYAGVRPPRAAGGFVHGHAFLSGHTIHGLLSGPSDPDITSQLNPAQAAWLQSVLTTFQQNTQAYNGLTGPALIAAFQKEWNTQMVGKAVIPLRTDGVLDQDTLCALTFAVAHEAGASSGFPDPTGQFCKAAPAPTATSTSPVVHKGLSTTAKVGIGVGIMLAGGTLYAVTRTPRKR